MKIKKTEIMQQALEKQLVTIGETEIDPEKNLQDYKFWSTISFGCNQSNNFYYEEINFHTFLLIDIRNLEDDIKHIDNLHGKMILKRQLKLYRNYMISRTI